MLAQNHSQFTSQEYLYAGIYFIHPTTENAGQRPRHDKQLHVTLGNVSLISYFYLLITVEKYHCANLISMITEVIGI